MTHSTVTHAEALRRLLAATKLIDYADCKDETVWQALGAAQGTAEGVLRDGEKQEPVAWWRYSYIDEDGSHDLDMYYGEDPAKHYAPNSHPWNALYTHPAPSLQAVGAVLDILQPGKSHSACNEAFKNSLHGLSYDKAQREDARAWFETGWFALCNILRNSPQPAAAPSGDVERRLQELAVYGISDADAISLIGTPAVNDAFLQFRERMGVTTTIKLVDAIVKAQAAITATKEGE